MLIIYRYFITLIFVYILMLGNLRGQDHPPIIPLPSSFNLEHGYFHLDPKVGIRYGEGLVNEGLYLQQEMFRKLEIPLLVSEHTPTYIQLEFDHKLEKGYRLEVEDQRILIRGKSSKDVFYGVISLIQLAENGDQQNGSIKLKKWKIQDQAAMDWRGLMLDESRHFFGVKKVKQLLDWMAYYKLNVFHWHLTDSPGWRIEIKGYPKLALVGGIGNHTDPYQPAQYYSQEEIREIVRYAMERKIDVIPEIDMPGHATAANRAYPEFSGGGSERYPEFTFHPAKEETYQYLTDILREVNTLFPSNLMHLGGDEVSFGNEKWVNDPFVKELMAREKIKDLIKDLKGVENYFFQRMADSLFLLNNKVLAWDEMANATLPKDKTIIFWWRHDQEKQLEMALENGYPTVICPRIPYYLDFVQEDFHQYGRKWAGAFAPLRAAYEFDVSRLPIKPGQEPLILGLQANLWTETVHNEQRLDFLLFPRIAALAEAAWSPDSQKSFELFSKRLEPHLKRYEREGIYFYHPWESDYHPEPIYRPKK